MSNMKLNVSMDYFDMHCLLNLTLKTNAFPCNSHTVEPCALSGCRLIEDIYVRLLNLFTIMVWATIQINRSISYSYVFYASFTYLYLPFQKAFNTKKCCCINSRGSFVWISISTSFTLFASNKTLHRLIMDINSLIKKAPWSAVVSYHIL